jgi:hypothetical protein
VVSSCVHEEVGCDDDRGWDLSVGKVELKQDWGGLALGWPGTWIDWGWTGLTELTDWIVKGGRRAGQGKGRQIRGILWCRWRGGGRTSSPSVWCRRSWTGLRAGSYVVVVMQMVERSVAVKTQAGCCRMKVRNVLTQPEQIDAAGSGRVYRTGWLTGTGGEGRGWGVLARWWVCVVCCLLVERGETQGQARWRAWVG